MKVYYSDLFGFPLPEGHRFPIQKYALLRERILREGLVRPEDLRVSEPARDDQLLLVHELAYLNKVLEGTLNPQDIRRIGFPWSPELVERSRRSVGGTIGACRSALAEGLAINLAGGTHHAYPDHGQGFCVFNDVAVAARVMQQDEQIGRVVVLDCDVHQGNGTAFIAQNDANLFTFSVHGQANFPFRKERSDLDIGLPDGAGDDLYLSAIRRGLDWTFSAGPVELAIFLAGADPYEGDRLGRLKVSKAGLAARDRLVLSVCRGRRIPVAIVMSGGYADPVSDIVDIHFETVRTAAEIFWAEQEPDRP